MWRLVSIAEDTTHLRHTGLGEIKLRTNFHSNKTMQAFKAGKDAVVLSSVKLGDHNNDENGKRLPKVQEKH